jgi:hypothetical protein
LKVRIKGSRHLDGSRVKPAADWKLEYWCRGMVSQKYAYRSLKRIFRQSPPVISVSDRREWVQLAAVADEEVETRKITDTIVP